MQIGPRIRIGGTLGKIGEKIKDYAPFIGAGGGGLGGVIQGEIIKSRGDTGAIPGNLKGDIVQGVKNLPLALGMSKLGGGGGAGGVVSGLLNGGGSALDFLKEHGGSALDLGLGAAGMVNAAKLGQQSTDYATGAMDTANANWKSREPLRLAGVQGMLNPQPTSDVSQIGAKARAANPFASKPLPLPVQR